MDKNIHSYTNTMDKKWIFLLIIDIGISDKLWRHLVEIEKTIPPYKRKSHKTMESQRTKGCRLKYAIMGNNSTIVSFLSQVLLL